MDKYTKPLMIARCPYTSRSWGVHLATISGSVSTRAASNSFRVLSLITSLLRGPRTISCEFLMMGR
jgi:hypothetical protein